MSDVKMIKTCSIWRALEVIGDKPTLLLIESYWMGARRFSEFQKQTGLLKTVISDRLQKLIAADCLVKVPYSQRPKRYDYKATEKMFDLFNVALSMLHWEHQWNSNPDKINIRLIHNACGMETKPKPVCGGCNDDVDPREISWREGPGVGDMPATYSRRRRQSAAKPDTETVLFDEIAEIMGDRWSVLIIRSIFTGHNRFQSIAEESGAATNILTDRLIDLAAKKVLQKMAAKQVGSGRSIYRLTKKGRDIYPIIVGLLEWGDRWYPSPDGPPLLLNHKKCGHDLVLKMACSACGEAIKVGDLDVDISMGGKSQISFPIAS